MSLSKVRPTAWNKNRSVNIFSLGDDATDNTKKVIIDPYFSKYYESQFSLLLLDQVSQLILRTKCDNGTYLVQWYLNLLQNTLHYVTYCVILHCDNITKGNGNIYAELNHMVRY